MWEGGERKESPAATRLVAAGLIDRWGEEKRMRGAFAPCQIEGERAQFEFTNVSAAAPGCRCDRSQMARVATHNSAHVAVPMRQQLSQPSTYKGRAKSIRANGQGVQTRAPP